MRIGERLAGFAGGWTGENKLRMLPEDEFSPSVSTATAALAAGGNVATITYTWADFDGVTQEGLLVVQDGPLPGQAEAVWADSWHANPRWMALIGAASAERVSLSGRYGEEDQQGEWHIHLHLSDAEGLLMTMENAYPAGAETYEVVRAAWRRPEAPDAATSR